MEYQIKIGIEAQSKSMAEDVAIDLITIKNSLSDADLKALAKMLRTNPGIVQTAKKLLGD